MIYNSTTKNALSASRIAVKALCLIILSFSGLANTHARPTIHLAAPENAPIQDISIQVLKQAYDKLGYEVEVHKLPNVRSLISANEGQYDGEVSRIANIKPKYPNLRSVPTAINVINVIATGQPTNKQIHKLKDFKDKVLCVRGIKLVEKLARKFGIDCSYVVNVNQAMTMINLGRAKYALLPETNAKATLQGLALVNVEIVSPVLHSEKLYHYLHNKKVNLLEPLNKILDTMHTTGEIDRIRSEYFDHQL